MKYTKSDSNFAPLCLIELEQGEGVRIENGAMAYHNGKVELTGKTNGGVMGGLMKKAFTGESFFVTTATGTAPGAQIAIAPGMIGDIAEIEFNQNSWFLNDGVFLACDLGVEIKTKSQGLGKAVFGGTGGLFIMEATGQGKMLINGFGQLSVLTLDGSNDQVIDNGHVVAWTSGLEYKIEAASGTFGFTSGEGLVNRFRGTGKVIVQSRNVSGFAAMVAKFISK
ncbi:MAG: TIGR00266 family protein [Bacilli bacterium]|jgi:uncharacterized protein (TIGR00266 family)|nr:TIGR00266 family protein [Bacilli bacterium]